MYWRHNNLRQGGSIHPFPFVDSLFRPTAGNLIVDTNLGAVTVSIYIEQFQVS